VRIAGIIDFGMMTGFMVEIVMALYGFQGGGREKNAKSFAVKAFKRGRS